MGKYTFTQHELDMLYEIATRFHESADGVMDVDTRHMVEKIEEGNPEIEFTEVERVDLQTILQAVIVMAEANPDPEFDPAFLKSLAEKLKS